MQTSQAAQVGGDPFYPGVATRDATKRRQELYSKYRLSSWSWAEYQITETIVNSCDTQVLDRTHSEHLSHEGIKRRRLGGTVRFNQSSQNWTTRLRPEKD